MRVTLNEVLAAGAFQRTFDWNVLFNQVPGGGADILDLNIRCLSAGQPKATGQSIEVGIHGHFIKIPGNYRPEQTITLTFVEDVNATIKNLISKWYDLCWDRETGIGSPAAKLTNVPVDLELTDSAGNVTWLYELYGVFLEDWDPGGELVGDTADVARPSITLSYDYYREPLAA